jgi:histidinol-phosphatase (PHP family)
MFEAACRAGLTVFGFAEHSPRPPGYVYPRDYQEALARSLPDYVAEVLALKERGRERGVTVLLGLELDYFPDREDFAAEVARSYPFDYIIGGLHFQGAWGFDFDPADWEPMGREERFAAYERYYRDLASMCRSGLFTIAAHPDLIKIFTPETFRDWLGTKSALPLIREALEALSRAGMLLEVSSAGLRRPCREIHPGPEIMRLARDLDVSVCFASDAHSIDHPAYAFDALAAYAGGFGYRESFISVRGRLSSIPFRPGLS